MVLSARVRFNAEHRGTAAIAVAGAGRSGVASVIK
jgi:hypothetical protein